MLTKINRYRKVVKDFANTRRAVKKLHHVSAHEIKLTTLAEDLTEDIDEAQKLHAAVYLRLGFVDEKDIKKGKMTREFDPHQQHALYFILKEKGKDGRIHVAATARQIQYKPEKGFLSFPLIEKAELGTKVLKDLISHDPNKCVEISGLAKHRETAGVSVLLLYRALWHHSLRQDHQLWIMACDPRLYQKLRILFGPAIQQVGRETQYKGASIIPAMLKPQEALNEFIRISRRRAWMFGVSRRELIGFFVEGLPPAFIPEKDKKYLKAILGRRS